MEQETTKAQSAKSSPLSRNGLRPEVARWAFRIVEEERQMQRDGTLARMQREAEEKRKKLMTLVR